jgi:hypothetical protein
LAQGPRLRTTRCNGEFLAFRKQTVQKGRLVQFMKLRQQRYGVCTASVQKGRKERQLYVRTLEPLIPQASALLQALAG